MATVVVAVAIMEDVAMVEVTRVDKQDKNFTFLLIFKFVITVFKIFSYPDVY